jgi:repressor LexA
VVLGPALSSAGPDTEGPLRVTDRQLEVLRAVRGWVLDRGRMPSVRELAAMLERSPSTIQQHLRALERRGYLDRDGSAHGLRLLVDDERLGLEGTGASLPVRAELRPGGSLIQLLPPFQRLKIGGEWVGGDYVVRVMGDALGPEGILQGDLLVVRPGEHEGEGPVLLEFLNGIATVKRVLGGKSARASLAPATPRFDRRRGRRPPLGFVVLGAVLEVVRRFGGE